MLIYGLPLKDSRSLIGNLHLIFKIGSLILRNDCLASFRDNRLMTIRFVGDPTVSAEISVSLIKDNNVT